MAMADETTKYANLRKALRKEDFERALKLANERTFDRPRRSLPLSDETGAKCHPYRADPPF